MAVTASPSSHLLIPFAGRSSPVCRAAMLGLRLPNLEALLAQLELQAEDSADADSLSPPHERALAASLGLSAPDGLLPWAAVAAREAAIAARGDSRAWAFLTLCHWQVSVSDVVCDDPQALQLEDSESQALMALARPFFAEDGITLHATDRPGRWLASGEPLRALPTASLDRVVGDTVGDWSPDAARAAVLRRLQTEIQMLFYTEPLNDQRMTRGLPPVNAFWISGTGEFPTTAEPSSAPRSAAAPQPPEVIDILRAPAQHDDGGSWARGWQALDAGPIAQLRQQAAAGAPVRLTLCGDRSARTWGAAGGGRLSRWLRGLRAGNLRVAQILEAL